MSERLTGCAEPRLTLRDYLKLPETNTPTEVVDGVLIVSAMATPRHQHVAMRLAVALDAARPEGFVILGPVEWLLSEEPLLIRQPDIAVVPRSVVDTNQPRLTTPPLLAVEIISAESRQRDLYVKRREYEGAGLLHYCVVEPEPPSITAHTIDDELGRRVTGDDVFEVAEPFRFPIRPADLL